jgi:hypothetical protein
MADKLKPCPFCGSDPVVTWEYYLSGSELYIRCDNGDCLGASFQNANPDTAVALWETRVKQKDNQ